MKTLAEEWKELSTALYASGMPAQNQEAQLHQMFFLTAMVMLNKLHEISELPEEVACGELSKLEDECGATLMIRMQMLSVKNRNT